MIVLQLWLLFGINYLLLCIGVVLFLMVVRITPLLKRLDRPTKEEIIGKMTTTEAQKEVIRAQMLLDEQYARIARCVASDMGKVLGGK